MQVAVTFKICKVGTLKTLLDTELIPEEQMDGWTDGCRERKRDKINR